MNKMRKTVAILPSCMLVLSLIGCSAEGNGIDHTKGEKVEIDHAQGEIAGEVTTDSVILQSRLTAICDDSAWVNCSESSFKDASR